MLIRLIGCFVSTLAISSVSFAQNAFLPAVAGSTPGGSITARERLRWLLHENLSPGALLQDAASGGEGTLSNTPKEYGPHWEGFAKRSGIAAANYGVGTGMEYSLGSVLGEDPRYERSGDRRPVARVGHVVKMTFFARNREGNTVPAYARLLAVPGSSFLANAWMPDSQSSLGDAALRTGLGFLGRMGGNAFREFRRRR